MVKKENAALITPQKEKKNENEEDLHEQMALLLREFNKFKSKYTRRQRGESSRKSSVKGNDREVVDKGDERLCYNCRKSGHFIANCPYPRVMSRWHCVNLYMFKIVLNLSFDDVHHGLIRIE